MVASVFLHIRGVNAIATTRIISMHVNKGKTIAQCLSDRTDYAKNPDKTNGGELISAYGCDHRTADKEFLLAQREYGLLTGRDEADSVIAYQVRQSFKPGEVSPEEAHQIGYHCALRPVLSRPSDKWRDIPDTATRLFSLFASF